MNEFLLHLALWAPLGAAAILLLAGGRLPESLAKVLALVGAAVPLACGIWLWQAFDPAAGASFQFVSRVDTGLSALGIQLKLGLNGVSLPMFLLAGTVGLAAVVYAAWSPAERLPLYLGLLLVMLSGLVGAFASVDVFFFYFFHELALIPTFLMVGIWGGYDRHFAAMKLTIYLTLGALLTLAGLIVLCHQSGASSFDLEELRRVLAAQPLGEAAQHSIYGLLLLGFGILVSLWPFHTWAPLGYGAAPTGAAMLHAGVLKKFGLYGLLQVALPLLPEGAAVWTQPLILLALANILVVGLVAVAQRDLKQMIGYGSVMHMGYAFLGLAAVAQGGPSAAAAAGGVLLLMVAHGLSVALLFLLATSLQRRTQTLEMDEMGGLVRRVPVLAGCFAVAILASVGVPGPGLANFWSEFAIFAASFQALGWWMAPAVLGVVITAVYGLRALARIFYGEPSAAWAAQGDRPLADLGWAERLPTVLLVLALVGVGVWPKVVTVGADAALRALYQPQSRLVVQSPPAVDAARP